MSRDIPIRALSVTVKWVECVRREGMCSKRVSVWYATTYRYSRKATALNSNEIASQCSSNRPGQKIKTLRD